MHSRTRSLKLSVSARLAVAALVFFSAATPSAQVGRRGVDPTFEERQHALRGLEARKSTAGARPPSHLSGFVNIRKELEQIRLRNAALSQAAAPDPAPDYARIRKEASEIRKRASRLKEYFEFPSPDGGRKPEKTAAALSPEGLRVAVASLDVLVNSLVTNQSFRQHRLISLEEFSKAGRDLESVISLSVQIRKAAEVLARGAARP